MDNVIAISIAVLCVVAILAAIILYLVAKKFKVEEDPRIDQVTELLPGANCGGCGFAGCRNFAESCVKSLEGKFCNVGGPDVMNKIAEILGGQVSAATPKVAVVRCAGSLDCRPKINNFEGAQSCAVVASTYGGETGCSFGCIGLGDCVEACSFGGVSINPITGLAQINESVCTACGACVKACPKGIIELRNKANKYRKVYVSCVNKDKGAVAKKACSSACIGCGKCAKVCTFEAITVENNVAYIDFNKCKMCRKCVEQCPTGAIKEENFPPRKPKEENPALNMPSQADKIPQNNNPEPTNIEVLDKNSEQLNNSKPM
ncbi:MAG: RnfABCDGE type electron transport complex subunit B [Bacteroidales bacterium]|nr:RnfABCDGE type electron transport complex subunit B [Bacteroidales bacterium]